MAASLNKMQVLSLYKSLMRESGKITSYNFRAYALRRIRDGFKDNKTLQDSEKIKSQLEHANANLSIIKRQAMISQMYFSDKLVIEENRTV